MAQPERGSGQHLNDLAIRVSQLKVEVATLDDPTARLLFQAQLQLEKLAGEQLLREMRLHGDGVPSWMGHRLTYAAVVAHDGEKELPALQAVCSCGWKGRRCTVDSNAEDDAMNHALWHDGVIVDDGAL